MLRWPRWSIETLSVEEEKPSAVVEKINVVGISLFAAVEVTFALILAPL